MQPFPHSFIPVRIWAVSLLIATCLGGTMAVAAESRDEKVRNDRDTVTEGGRWIYNDLGKGFEEARAKGMPMCVVIRCVP